MFEQQARAHTQTQSGTCILGSDPVLCAVRTSSKLRVSVMAAVGNANAMISVAFTTTAEVSALGLKFWPRATLSNGDVGK